MRAAPWSAAAGEPSLVYLTISAITATTAVGLGARVFERRLLGNARLYVFVPPRKVAVLSGNETSCELPELLKVARLGQRLLLRRPAPENRKMLPRCARRGDSRAADL